MIPLSKLQNEIMSEFYGIPQTKVVFTKAQRKQIWSALKNDSFNYNMYELYKLCPALVHTINKSRVEHTNIQSAIFSECVYAQTLANMLHLDLFINCQTTPTFLSDDITSLISSYHLQPRFAYSNSSKSRMLIQAGSCAGIDSALISVSDLNIYTIEFKEPKAKASEPNLPKYDESGQLKITEDFIEQYPQFQQMLEEKRDLNFFEIMGTNVKDFSVESINIAITNNYVKKYADVVCTEDKNSYFVMIPCNQIAQWASISGEIRPAGKNHCDVWTPKFLQKSLENLHANIVNGIVEIPKNLLHLRKPRGGKNISGYKINNLLFVYKYNCIENDSSVTFPLNAVQQLIPTIAGKMDFSNIKYTNVKQYYFPNIK